MSIAIRIEHADDRFATVIADVKGAQGLSRYFMPLTIRWTRYTNIDRSPASVLCAVRRGPREGTLLDATTEPEFITALLAKIHAGDTIGNDLQRLEFRPTAAFAATPLTQIDTIKAVDREQSNSSVIVDDQYVVKILRRVTPVIHPEIEVGRFLADVAHFQNAPTLLGTLELVEGDSRTALAVVHDFIENQGDAWTVTGAGARPPGRRAAAAGRRTPFRRRSETASMLQRMRQIGTPHRRDASRFRQQRRYPRLRARADHRRRRRRAGPTLVSRAHSAVFELLERGCKELPERAAMRAQRLLAQPRGHHRSHRRWNGTRPSTACKIRHHGDFHLGQVLIAKDDAYILDFEGEPRRTLEERRAKAPPARDVAGFIRSIDYAASAARRSRAEPKPGRARRRRQRHPRLGRTAERRLLGELSRDAGRSPLWPADEDQTQALLDLFLLEKALYEIEYELTNRPGWAHIPLGGDPAHPRNSAG